MNLKKLAKWKRLSLFISAFFINIKFWYDFTKCETPSVFQTGVCLQPKKSALLRIFSST